MPRDHPATSGDACALKRALPNAFTRLRFGGAFPCHQPVFVIKIAMGSHIAISETAMRFGIARVSTAGHRDGDRFVQGLAYITW